MEELMLRGMLASPDDTSRLVMADWLEEQSDPRAAVIREAGESERRDIPLMLVYWKIYGIQAITYEGQLYHFYAFGDESYKNMVGYWKYKVMKGQCVRVKNKSLDQRNWLANMANAVVVLISETPLWVQVAYEYLRNGKIWPRVGIHIEDNAEKSD